MTSLCSSQQRTQCSVGPHLLRQCCIQCLLARCHPHLLSGASQSPCIKLHCCRCTDICRQTGFIHQGGISATHSSYTPQANTHSHSHRACSSSSSLYYSTSSNSCSWQAQVIYSTSSNQVGRCSSYADLNWVQGQQAWQQARVLQQLAYS